MPRSEPERPHPSFARSESFALRLFYWGPDQSVNPHEHDLWTVGGILLNEVEVSIYDNMGDATPVRRYLGHEGDVGVLDPPTVHQLTNRTDELAVTIHLFGNETGSNEAAPESDGAAPDGHRSKPTKIDLQNDYRKGLRQRTESSIVAILAARPSEHSMKILRAVARIGSDKTKSAGNRGKSPGAQVSARCRIRSGKGGIEGASGTLRRLPR